MFPALGFCLLSCAVAQEPVEYEVFFPNVVHHEADIRVTFRNVNGPLDVRMSRSSPGRYALHEFGKNVYNVSAFTEGLSDLRIERPDAYTWRIPEHDGTVVFNYTLFADRAGGTYAQIDETHAHLNMPAVFMWARGMMDRPVSVKFHPAAGAGWKVATQLFPTGDPMRFTAPNTQYFLDSPTELSAHAVREWTVTSNGTRYPIRLAIHHQGTEAEVDAYRDMVQKVVMEEIAVFGETPAYDVGHYTFIADYLPYASGDGMEHRNSTILASTGSLSANAMGLLGTVSHEFFHAWNVERMRPATLEPFDFERANMSQELWFAEGFTSYYAPLFIRRAGLMTNEQFADDFQGRLNTVMTAPGRRFFNAVEMSMQAPFVDAATAIDPDNRLNTFISYYTWGAMIGLNLDLSLRGSYGLTLDDYMRFVWERFGRPETPYTVDDLARALADFTGNRNFAADFFERFVWSNDVPDYDGLLNQAGFAVRLRNAGKAIVGYAQFRYDQGGALIASGTTIGLPLYEAGLDRGDRIVQFDGRGIRTAADLAGVLDRHQPGEPVSVLVQKRSGQMLETELELAEDPRIEVVTFEELGRPVPDAVRDFRTRWLGSRGN